MKVLTKFLLIGTIIGTAVYIWYTSWPSRSDLAAPAEATFISRTSTISADVSSTAFQVRPWRSPNHPLVDTITSLHSVLREWRRSEVNDPDDEEGRDQLIEAMLATLTDDNVPEIVQSLSVEEMNTPFAINALHRWMKVTPLVVTNWLALRPETTEEQTAAVAEDWIRDRDGLRQYLDQLPDTAWKQKILSALSSGMSASDPLAAIKLAQEMVPGDAQINLLRAATCGWVDTNPAAALDWVASVKDSSLREPLIAAAFQSYALIDPASAATWLLSDVKSDSLVKEAALNILETWVTKNPAEAANWASRFPEGKTKVAAVQLVSKYWQQADPDQAAAWVARLTRGLATPIY